MLALEQGSRKCGWPSRAFQAVVSLIQPHQIQPWLEKNSFFPWNLCCMWSIHGKVNWWGSMEQTHCSQVIYSFILLFSSVHRGGWHCRQVQNVLSCPKKPRVSLLLIIIARAHGSALHTFKDSLRINFQNGIAWEKQTDRSRQLYI